MDVGEDVGADVERVDFMVAVVSEGVDDDDERDGNMVGKEEVVAGNQSVVNITNMEDQKVKDVDEDVKD